MCEGTDGEIKKVVADHEQLMADLQKKSMEKKQESSVELLRRDGKK